MDGTDSTFHLWNALLSDPSKLHRSKYYVEWGENQLYHHTAVINDNFFIYYLGIFLSNLTAALEVDKPNKLMLGHCHTRLSSPFGINEFDEQTLRKRPSVFCMILAL